MLDSSTAAEPRERVLAAAEQLFSQKGYAAVTLREIGVRAGLHHSSLYHHIPGGKEALYVEVMERMFARHQQGLTQALSQEGDVRQQLYAIADWLLRQAPLDLVRMEYADMPALSTQSVQRLADGAYLALLVPIEAVLGAAVRRGEISYDDLSVVAGGLLGMIESLHAVSEEVAGKSHQEMARRLLDVMLDGLRPRTT